VAALGELAPRLTARAPASGGTTAKPSPRLIAVRNSLTATVQPRTPAVYRFQGRILGFVDVRRRPDQTALPGHPSVAVLTRLASLLHPLPHLLGSTTLAEAVSSSASTFLDRMSRRTLLRWVRKPCMTTWTGFARSSRGKEVPGPDPCEYSRGDLWCGT
jgi:hypothetical protein